MGRKERFELTATVIADDKNRLKIIETDNGMASYDSSTHTMFVPKQLFWDDSLTDLLLSCVFADSAERRFEGKSASSQRTYNSKTTAFYAASQHFTNAEGVIKPAIDEDTKYFLDEFPADPINQDANMPQNTWSALTPAEVRQRVKAIIMPRLQLIPRATYLSLFNQQEMHDCLVKDFTHNQALENMFTKCFTAHIAAHKNCPSTRNSNTTTNFALQLLNLYLMAIGIRPTPDMVDALTKPDTDQEVADENQLTAEQAKLNNSVKKMFKDLFNTQQQIEQLENTGAPDPITQTKIQQMQEQLANHQAALGAMDPTTASPKDIKNLEKTIAKEQAKLEELEDSTDPQALEEQTDADIEALMKQLVHLEQIDLSKQIEDAVTNGDPDINKTADQIATASITDEVNVDRQAKGCSQSPITNLLKKLATVDFTSIQEPEDESILALLIRKIIKKDFNQEPDHNGRLNMRYLAGIISDTLAEETPIYTETIKRDRKTIVNLMFDASGSMASHGGLITNVMGSSHTERVTQIDTSKEISFVNRFELVRGALRYVLLPLMYLQSINDNIEVHAFAFADDVSEMDINLIAADRKFLEAKPVMGTHQNAVDLRIRQWLNNADIGGGTNLFKTIDKVTTETLTQHPEENIVNIVCTDAGVGPDELDQIVRNLENNHVKQFFLALQPDTYSNNSEYDQALETLTGGLKIETLSDIVPIFKEILENAIDN